VSSAGADRLAIRAGVHTREGEFVGGDVRGVAVHEVARILSVAEPGEVLVSAVTRTWHPRPACGSTTAVSTS
jgi:class 3 adenylate cyclase